MGEDADTMGPAETESPPDSTARKRRRRAKRNGGRSASSSQEPRKLSAPSEQEVDQLADLLAQARRFSDGYEWQKAVELLEAHRVLALRSSPESLLEALPIAAHILEERPYAARAKEYLAATAEALTKFPDLHERYQANLQESERRKAETEIDELLGWQSMAQARSVLYLVILGVVFAIGVAALVVSAFVGTGSAVLRIIGAALIPLAVVLAAGLYVLRRARETSIDARIENLERRKQIAAVTGVSIAGPESATETQYFSKLVTINVVNLGDYYALVKVHTNNSFLAALGAGIAGFVLIGTGVGYGFLNGSSNDAIAYVAAASGILVDFIAGVFFVLYNRTVRQLKDYHDSLLSVQNILLAFKVVADSGDSHRPELLEKILS